MTAAERRAAEITRGAGKQAQLKQEAADRRAERAQRDAEAPAATSADPRRRLPRG